MTRLFPPTCALLVLIACSQADNPTVAPSILPTSGTASFSSATFDAMAALAPTGHASNSCSDDAPIWHSRNSTTDRGSFTAEFRPVYNIDTYVVTILYAKDRATLPLQIRSWRQNGTEIRLIPWEGSGVYYVKVQVKNRCDVIGRFSEVLSVEMGAGENAGAPPPKVWCGYCHKGGRL